MGWIIALLVIVGIIGLCFEFFSNLTESLGDVSLNIIEVLRQSTMGKLSICSVIISIGATIIHKFILPIDIFKSISVWSASIAVILVVINVIIAILTGEK